MKKCKLLITDLDGTLIETVSGDTFPKGIWDMKIKLDVFEAIKNYAPDDILIISNQGGIEKGFVDREMFEYKFDYISNALEDYTDISVIDGNAKIANLIVLSNRLAIFFVILYQLSSPVKVPISVLPRLVLIPAS